MEWQHWIWKLARRGSRRLGCVNGHRDEMGGWMYLIKVHMSLFAKLGPLSDFKSLQEACLCVMQLWR